MKRNDREQNCGNERCGRTHSAFSLLAIDSNWKWFDQRRTGRVIWFSRNEVDDKWLRVIDCRCASQSSEFHPLQPWNICFIFASSTFFEFRPIPLHAVRLLKHIYIKSVARIRRSAENSPRWPQRAQTPGIDLVNLPPSAWSIAGPKSCRVKLELMI